MFKPFLLSISLIAIQSLSLAAYADSEKLAFVQPPSSPMSTCKAALEQETRLVEAQAHVVPGVAIYAHNFGYDEANRLAKDGVLIGTDSVGNYIDLQSGNILLSPEKDIIVNTHAGKIYIESGATVFISELGNNVVIYDLHQTQPKQVSIMLNKHKLVMEPGRMLVVTAQNIDDFEQLEVNCHCVTYRNAKPVNMNVNGVKAFLAEFSIASALVTIQPLQRLTVSSHKQDQIALERILKGAVILGDFAMSTEQPTTASSSATAAHADPGAINIADAGKNQ